MAQNESMNDRLIVVEQAFKYVKDELLEIKGLIKSLATLRDIADMDSKIGSVERRLDAQAKEIEEMKTRYWELAIKVAVATGALTILVELVLNNVFK